MFVSFWLVFERFEVSNFRKDIELEIAAKLMIFRIEDIATTIKQT